MNVDTEDLPAVEAAAESQGTAAAIGTNLHEIGYNTAKPQPAEAAVSDVEIATLSVITFNQCIDGVSVEDAESDSFQATLVAAVDSQIQSGT